MRTSRGFRSKKGNAMLEFGLSAPLALLMLAGTFQYGYTFYVYNQLQLAVRSGVRYASLMDYGSSCADTAQDMVKNVVVYGSPAPAAGASPVVRGLSKSNVNVSFGADSKGVPTDVTMSVSGFSVNALFATFTFNQKPFASVPWVGRYAGCSL